MRRAAGGDFRQRTGWGERMPWLFVAGVASYLSLQFEPGVPVWAGAAVVAAICLVLVPRGGRVLPFCLAAVVFLSGIAWTAFRAHRADHPVWQERRIADVEGRVAGLEMRPRGRIRLLLDDVRLDGAEMPMRVRVSVSARAGAPRPGARVALRAVLYPPAGPAYPGGFDFGRRAWFGSLGAVGYATRGWREIAPPSPGDVTARLRAWRWEAAHRILAAFPSGDARAGIAAALVVGERGGIPEDLAEHYRASGLAHMLAISGLHMGLLAGLAFLILRRGLTLIPGVALRYPIKKWAAALALVLSAAYLAISGASVPTQRAFVMTAVALLAVLLDRSPLSLRLVGVAAVAVAASDPEAVLGASFQMSFAAATALIAVYGGTRRRAVLAEAAPWLRLPVVYAAGLLSSTLIASLATAPFALFHFGRVSLYALPANLLSLPVLGFWVMPWGLVSALALPFDLAAFPLARMAEGIGWIDRVAAMVSAWPAHQISAPQMPGSGLLLCVVGMLACVFARGRWRLLGAASLALGIVTPWLVTPPDVLVADGGRAVAVRLEDGYGFAGDERAEFVRGMWRERTASDIRFGRGWTCAMSGCAASLPSGASVSVVRRERGLAESCRGSVVVAVMPVAAPARRACGADVLLDAADLRRYGSVALWLRADGSVRRFESAGESRGGRPWGRGAPAVSSGE